MPKCVQCKKNKKVSMFPRRRGKPTSTCKSCRAKNRREVETRKLRKLYNITKDQIPGDIILCGACDTVKSLKEFAKDNSTNGYSGKCNDCKSEGKLVLKKDELFELRRQRGFQEDGVMPLVRSEDNKNPGSIDPEVGDCRQEDKITKPEIEKLVDEALPQESTGKKREIKENLSNIAETHGVLDKDLPKRSIWSRLFGWLKFW